MLVAGHYGLRFIVPLHSFVPFDRAVSAILVALLLVYWAIDYHSTGQAALSSRTASAKMAIIAVSIMILAVAPTFFAIALRHQTAPHLFVHDGLIQTEEAARLTLQGENPYQADYSTTPMGDWAFAQEGVRENPALRHFPYLPVTFLLPIPFRAVALWLLGWFDLRMVYLLAFLLLIALAALLPDTPLARRLLVISIGLNPLFIPFLVEGRNDVLVLFFFALTLLLLRDGHGLGSSAALAIACATKPFVWPFVPFHFICLAANQSRADKRRWLPMATFALLTLALVLPWLTWSPRDFLGDTLAFQSGSLGDSYPIAGVGFSAALLQVGILQSPLQPWPFWIVQLAATAVFASWGLLRTWREPNNLNLAVGGFVLVLAAGLFVSRSFHDNYLAFLLSVLALGAFIGQPRWTVHQDS